MTKMPTPREYRLLTEFRRLFEGKIYKHRDSSQGDFVAMHLYEDLIAINRSGKLIDAASNRKDRVLIWSDLVKPCEGLFCLRAAIREVFPPEPPVAITVRPERRGAVKGAPVFGAAERTLDCEHRSDMERPCQAL